MARARRTQDAHRRAPSKSAAKSLLLDSLEHRQHLAADLNVAINFQPASAPKVTGMLVDSGLTYRNQNGLSYGWTFNQSSSARDRNATSDQDKDTLILMGSAKWELAVPNGRYTVTVNTGDPKWLDSRYHILAEGTTVVQGRPTAANRYLTGTVTVQVTDGKLTLSNGPAYYNNKISSVVVVSANTVGSGNSAKPAPPSSLRQDGVSTKAVNLVWNDNSSNEQGFYVQQSTDGVNWFWVATTVANDNTVTVSGLQAKNSYKFRVASFNAAGQSSYSPSLYIETPGNTPVVTAPAVPTGLAASSITANGLKLTWTDQATNETAYYVERAPAGSSSFTRIATLPTNSTSFTVSGLAASTGYQFRVAASNTAGTSFSSTINATTPAGSNNNGGGGNNNNGGGGTDPSVDGYIPYYQRMTGLNANTEGQDPAKFIQPMKSLGVKKVRIWYGVKSWTSIPSAGYDKWYIDRVKLWKNAGFEVMLNLNIDKAPANVADAKKMYQHLLGTGLGQYVDKWQIANEVNWKYSFSDTMENYVNKILKPAYEVFHAAGEKVVGAGITWDVKAAEKIVQLGYLNYVDYAAFHPYGPTAKDVIARTKGAAAAFAGKPLIITEWNIHQTAAQPYNNAQRAKELDKVAREMGQYVDSAYYFGLTTFNDPSGIGQASLFTPSAAPNGNIYNVFDSWLPD
jgi:hypothetical protein